MENDPLDIQFVRARYAKARNRFKPRQVTTLLITEGPPNNLDRYFYFEDVRTHDSLFLEIMGVLYPEQKKRYLASGRDAMLKEALLENFQEDGYWLLDLAEIPCSLVDVELGSCIPSLLERLTKNEIDKRTPIILIKANMYDMCYAPLLKLGYNVQNERIPFPGSGQQRVFRTKFSKLIVSS